MKPTLDLPSTFEIGLTEFALAGYHIVAGAIDFRSIERLTMPRSRGVRT